MFYKKRPNGFVMGVFFHRSSFVSFKKGPKKNVMNYIDAVTAVSFWARKGTAKPLIKQDHKILFKELTDIFSITCIADFLL